MNILISGAGIAGPTLAYWLARHGFTPTLVERAPQLRTGGYVIDFWGAGYDVAEAMGILPELKANGYEVQELRMVGRDGQTRGALPVELFRQFLGGRFFTIARSQLAASIHGALAGRVETIFGDSITALEESATGVRVRFERSRPREFDLVVGADGLHSQVRRLAFGADSQFERYLGCRVAVFEVAGYRPRDEDVYVLYTQVGCQVGRFTMRNDRTLFLFVFADPSPVAPSEDNVDVEKTILRRRFENGGWECGDILDAMERAESFYFDRVSQVRMPRWTRGRIALVGDAAFCPSLLAGQGSALAMIAAYVLAGELKAAHGEHGRALAEYEHRLSAFMARKQDAARGFVDFFAPRSRLRLFLRNHLMSLLKVPSVARFVIGRDFADRVSLPPY